MVWYAGVYAPKRRMCQKFLSNYLQHTVADFLDIKVALREWKWSFVRKVNITANSL